jgi:hypothetical protein
MMADRCIELCDSNRVDPFLLFSLRHWHWLDGCRFGTKFKAFIELNTTLTTREMTCDGYKGAFERRLRSVLGQRGVQNLAPELRVEGWRKDEVMTKWQESQRSGPWPPHKPYMLQMRPGKYILVSNFQAGFHLVRAMTGTGKFRADEGRNLPVTLLYESQVEGEPCRIILDCEAYLVDYEGLLTEEEVVESVRQVPQVLTKRLVAIGAITSSDTVMAVEKDKSREGKVSRHFTLNIVGIPTGDLKIMFQRVVLAPYQALRSRRRLEKSGLCISRCVAASKGPDGVYADALLHVDPTTVKGLHQFSLAFSRKEGEEPARINWVHWIMNGGDKVKRVKSKFHGVPLVPSHESALDMLLLGGFVHWTPNTLVLSRKFWVGTDLGLNLFPSSVSASSIYFFSKMVQVVSCHET